MKNKKPLILFDYYLFDLDNTIISISNPDKYFGEILAKTINHFSKNLNLTKSMRERFWIDKSTIFQKLDIKKERDFWVIFDRIDYEMRPISIKLGEIKLFSDVVPILKKLCQWNKKLAVISNTGSEIVEYLLEHFEIRKYFNVVFAIEDEEDEKIAKPSPLGIHKILNSLGYQKSTSKALVIGDSKDDVYAAKRANVFSAFLVRNHNQHLVSSNGWEFPPDFIIKNLMDLIPK